MKSKEINSIPIKKRIESQISTKCNTYQSNSNCSQASFIYKNEESFCSLNDSVFSIVNKIGEGKNNIPQNKINSKHKSEKGKEKLNTPQPKFNSEDSFINAKNGISKPGVNASSLSSNKKIESSFGFSYFDDE